jgi:hypothetical protein
MGRPTTILVAVPGTTGRVPGRGPARTLTVSNWAGGLVYLRRRWLHTGTELQVWIYVKEEIGLRREGKADEAKGDAEFDEKNRQIFF